VAALNQEQGPFEARPILHRRGQVVLQCLSPWWKTFRHPLEASGDSLARTTAGSLRWPIWRLTENTLIFSAHCHANTGAGNWKRAPGLRWWQALASLCLEATLKLRLPMDSRHPRSNAAACRNGSLQLAGGEALVSPLNSTEQIRTQLTRATPRVRSRNTTARS